MQTKKLEDLEEKQADISPGKMQAVKSKYSKCRSEWVSRKRKVLEFVDMIADAMEKKRKIVMVSRLSTLSPFSLLLCRKKWD